MQFRLSILAAFLAASASAYADSISGAEVTKHLESLTNGAKDLNSRLKSNKDSDSTGQMILSGEEKLANDKANMGYTFAEFGASTVVPEDQNAVCQSLLAYYNAEQELLLTIIEKRNSVQFPLQTAPIVTALGADHIMSDSVSVDVFRMAPTCSDDVRQHFWVTKAAFVQATTTYTRPSRG